MTDYLYQRPLPDGRDISVIHLSFGRARIIIGPYPFIDDGY